MGNLTSHRKKTQNSNQNNKTQKREREFLQFYEITSEKSNKIHRPMKQERGRELKKLTLKMRLLFLADHAKPPLKCKVQTNTKISPAIANTCAANVKGSALTLKAMLQPKPKPKLSLFLPLLLILTK